MSPFSFGLFTTFAGMSIVFVGLIALYCVVTINAWFISRQNDKKSKDVPTAVNGDMSGSTADLSDDELAAVGMALHIYRLRYEEAENFKLTGTRIPQEHRPYTLAGRLQEISRDRHRGFIPGHSRGAVLNR